MNMRNKALNNHKSLQPQPQPLECIYFGLCERARIFINGNGAPWPLAFPFA